MGGSASVRIVALQPALRWLQPLPNMHLIRQTLEAHFIERPADVVVLPEAFNGMPVDVDPFAGSPSRKFLRTLAAALGTTVVGGSIDMKVGDGPRRNMCFVVDASGRECGAYSKRVLFAHEQEHTTAGASRGIFEVSGLRIGVLICGDLWEPALARELLDEADVLCVPAKTTVPSDAFVAYARKLWWNLALTRAMENGLPVVISDWAADRHEAVSSAHAHKVRAVHYTCGASSIVDPGRRPDFDTMQRTVTAGHKGIVEAEIDLEAVAAYRRYRRSVGLLPGGPESDKQSEAG